MEERINKISCLKYQSPVAIKTGDEPLVSYILKFLPKEIRVCGGLQPTNLIRCIHIEVSTPGRGKELTRFESLDDYKLKFLQKNINLCRELHPNFMRCIQIDVSTLVGGNDRMNLWMTTFSSFFREKDWHSYGIMTPKPLMVHRNLIINVSGQ